MAQYTPNYNLKKPDYSDVADVMDFNGNSDIIDITLKNLNVAIDELGTASSLDVGTTQGTIPVLSTGGKLDNSVLPSIAITDTFVVNSESAMLAIVGQVGDVAIRTDLDKSFILATEPTSVLENWAEILAPAPDLSLYVLKDGSTAMNNLTVTGDIYNSGSYVSTTINLEVSKTLHINDRGKRILANSESPLLITVPTNTSVPYPIGTEIQIIQYGTGEITIEPDVGVIIKSKDNKSIIDGQYTGVTLIKVAADTWLLIGGLK